MLLLNRQMCKYWEDWPPQFQSFLPLHSCKSVAFTFSSPTAQSGLLSCSLVREVSSTQFSVCSRALAIVCTMCSFTVWSIWEQFLTHSFPDRGLKLAAQVPDSSWACCTPALTSTCKPLSTSCTRCVLPSSPSLLLSPTSTNLPSNSATPHPCLEIAGSKHFSAFLEHRLSKNSCLIWSTEASSLGE